MSTLQGLGEDICIGIADTFTEDLCRQRDERVRMCADMESDDPHQNIFVINNQHNAHVDLFDCVCKSGWTFYGNYLYFFSFL